MEIELQRESETTRPGRAEPDWFWTVVFVGTMGSAGLYGLIQGGIAGAIVGPFLALLVGVPVFISTAIVAWAFWLTRYRLAFAVLAGALTGLLCTIWADATLFTLSYEASLALAPFLGGTGAGLAGLLFGRNADAGRRLTADSTTPSCTLSLRQTFVHFAALTVVIAFWACTIGAVRHVAEQDRLRAIERRDQWIADTTADLRDGNRSVFLYSCINTDLLLEGISGMPEVREITFEQTIDLTDEGLNQLPSFPNLIRVEFRGEPSLNDQNIALLSNCQNLESVVIIASNVTDAGLKTLAEIPQLKQFQHRGQFSEAALEELRQKLPNCIISEVEWHD